MLFKPCSSKCRLKIPTCWKAVSRQKSVNKLTELSDTALICVLANSVIWLEETESSQNNVTIISTLAWYQGNVYGLIYLYSLKCDVSLSDNVGNICPVNIASRFDLNQLKGILQWVFSSHAIFAGEIRMLSPISDQMQLIFLHYLFSQHCEWMEFQNDLV